MASPAEPQRIPTVIVTIDGLRAAALGAYGQTAYETPAFDALAADGLTHEWCYAATPDPRDLFRALAGTTRWGPVVRLVTDDARIAAASHEAIAHVETLDLDPPREPASAIDQTYAAGAWQGFAAAIADSAPDDGEAVWLHTRGLYGPWDAPLELIEAQRDEDDVAIGAGVTPPEAEVAAGDEDTAFAAACRYAAEVMVHDACLAGWRDIAEGVFEGHDWRLVVAGTRGFPLGEHGRVGGVDPRLFSEQMQVPLLVLTSESADAFTRENRPLTLAAGFAANRSGRRVELSSASNAAALLENDRLLRRPGADEAGEEAELYVKPDDRWEQNDIAKLEPDRADQMLASLAGDDSGVANPRDPA